MASLIITLIEIIGAFYLQVMLDEYIPSQKISTLGFITLGLIITYVAQQIIAFAKEYLLIILGQRLVIDVILTYIKHIFILPMSFFRQDEREKSHLASLMPIKLLMLWRQQFFLFS